jgi:hypothetical protein
MVADKAGETASAIAALLDLAAIRVENAVTKIGLRRSDFSTSST